jgi:hypothetical protein
MSLWTIPVGRSTPARPAIRRARTTELAPESLGRDDRAGYRAISVPFGSDQIDGAATSSLIRLVLLA